MAAPRLWRYLEPAHSRPLLPPWPWQQLQLPIPEKVPVQNLTPGWRATSLGNPAGSHYQACWKSLPRTPWDLALFDGKLYVGLGNSSNEGPSANAGPVPLFAYDLKQRRWQQEATLPEEQISRFLVDDKQLWIAGEDPRSSWRWGNLYRHTDRDRLWWQQRRLPRFIHAHDLAEHRGNLVVAGNVPDAVSTGLKAERHGSALAMSGDTGQTWSVHRLVGWRATALLRFPNALFAVEALPGPKQKQWLQKGQRWKPWTAVHQWHAEKGWQPKPEITVQQLLPGVRGAGARAGWIDAATPNLHGVAWIASLGPWGAESPRRSAFVGVVDSGAGLRVHAVDLGLDAQAMDWQPAGDGWLLLSSRPLPKGGWRTRLQRYWLAAQKLRTGNILAEFDAPLPASSLAGFQGNWIVGLGHPPFAKDVPSSVCKDWAPFSGTVLMLST